MKEKVVVVVVLGKKALKMDYLKGFI